MWVYPRLFGASFFLWLAIVFVPSPHWWVSVLADGALVFGIALTCDTAVATMHYQRGMALKARIEAIRNDNQEPE